MVAKFVFFLKFCFVSPNLSDTVVGTGDKFESLWQFITISFCHQHLLLTQSVRRGISGFGFVLNRGGIYVSRCTHTPSSISLKRF
jgi:hypothetical protein